MNKFTFTPEQAFCYISQEVLNSNDFRLLDRFAENSVDNSTDYTSIVSLQTKLSDPLLPNKPLLLAAFQGSLLVIPNLFTHEEGKGKPSFAAAFKSRTSASILKMKAISDHKHTIDVPPLAEILKLDTLSNLKQAFIDHDDDDDNEIEGYSCILVDKSFISILFREGKDSTPALDILSHYTEIARRDESLAKSPWFLRLYGFLSQLIKDSTEGTSSTPDAIDGDFINPIEKQFKSTIKIVKSSITTFNNSDFKIPPKKSTSIDSSPVSSNASLKDDDDSSIPIVGTGLAPFDLDQDEVSKVPESVTVVPDTKSVATINFEDQKGTFNCTGSDLLKLIASSSHSTASKSIGSLMSEESKLWIIALDRTISGATRELSPSLTDAIKATSFQDVSNSLKWKMMNLFGATRTIDAPQEQMIKNFLSNKITSDNRMATNPEDMVGLSIACFKPEHRAFTHKKDKFQFFIADNETDFLEQLEAFVIFLRSILLPDSFIVLKTIELENDFKQSRQGLRNQFTLYKESFGLYLTRVIHNSFTQFAIKAKWDPNAMPTGLDLSWITREIQSGKDYNLVAPVKRKEYDAPKSKSAKAPASKKSRGTENLTKQFTDWHLDSSKSTYGEHFGAQPIKDMNPPIPTFEGKKLCIKSIFGNCSKKNCTFSHARVKKGDKSMNEWISKNKLPITFIGSKNIESQRPPIDKSKTTLSPPVDERKRILTNPTSNLQKDSKPARKKLKSSSRLVNLIRTAFQSTCVGPSPSRFQFENTSASAEHNFNVLMNTNLDIAKAVENEKGSCLSPHTEFRDVAVINPLFDLHEDGSKLSIITTEGASYPFDETIDYNEDLARNDLIASISKGNNKSTSGKEEFLKSVYDKEVTRGWALPIPAKAVTLIPGIAVTPVGVAKQFSIDKSGAVIRKDRMTHDCSQPGVSGLSVNLRVNKDKLEEVQFGFALMRILYQIHQLRVENPQTSILLSKFDFDSAYRRMYVRLCYALLCTTIIGPIAYILFRLPFGSSPAAGLFSLLSEFVVDLSQALVEDVSWDPSTLKSSLAFMIPPPAYQIGLFTHAKDLLVDITTKGITIECYIDDMIIVCLDSAYNIERALNAIPLILDTIFRPLLKERVTRMPILNYSKTIAESRLEEIKIILGWLINTRTMRIHLPDDKVNMWVRDLDSLISQADDETMITFQELESMIGKLNHTCFIVKEGYFFLNRLRYRLKMTKLNRNQYGRFDTMERLDLLLWKDILLNLRTSSIGRSFNSILRTIIEIVTISDASLFGMGGYFIVGNYGFGWRYELPADLLGFFTLNFLEFLASYWTLKTPARLRKGTKFLSISDSMNSLSWMTRNKFNPHLQPMHDIIARAYGRLVSETDCSNDKSHIDVTKVRPNKRSPSGVLRDLRGKFGESLLVATCNQAENDAARATTSSTESKRIGDIFRWQLFLSKAGKSKDLFLKNIGSEERFQLCDYVTSFLVQYRYNQFRTKASGEIKVEQLNRALSNIAQAFRNEGLRDPSRDQDGKRHPKISRLLQTYSNEDPPVNRQPPLPMSFYKSFASMKATKISEAIGQVVSGALHFGMRSCEFSKSDEKYPRTKIIRICDIKFYDKHGTEVKTSRRKAYMVKLTFINQKNGVKNEVQIRYRPTKISSMNVVFLWAKIVERIESYNESSPVTTINAFEENGKMKYFSSTSVRKHIKAAVLIIGEETLGVKSSEIGTRTVRTSYATMLSHQHVDPKVIQKAGRWLSDVFMRYIRSNTTLVKLSDAMVKASNDGLRRLK